jgi:cytochrome P450
MALIRIAAGVVGLDGIESQERARALLKVHNVMLEALTARWSTRSPEELERDGLAMKAEFIRDFYEPARRRRAELIAAESAGELDDEPPLDLITVLLREPAPEDADLPVRLCINMVVASVSSTASSLVHLVNDLTTWLADHPEDRALVRDPTFMRGAINESLRLHPVTPAQVRCATRDLTLPSGRTVKDGETLALVTGSANRDKSAFGDDADEFNPRRYERLPRRTPPYGLAFGWGRHLCLGKPLVTTTGQSEDTGDQDLHRTSMRVLRALVDAGIDRDPERPPTPARSHMDRYERYPVIFRNL